MPTNWKDDLEVLAILNGVIKAIDEIGELDFDFDKDYSEEEKTEKTEKTEGKEENTMDVDFAYLAHVYGSFFSALLDEGFTREQSFKLVEMYVSRSLELYK